MWGTHFSPLFDAALENPSIHDLEHVLYLVDGAAVLVAGRRARPGAVADAPPGRALYVFLQMPQNTFLAVVILERGGPSSTRTTRRCTAPWGPTPLEDQQLAGAIMWVAGDILFLAAIFAILAGWMRSEERDIGADRPAGAPWRWPRSAPARRVSPSGSDASRSDRRASRREAQPGSGVSRNAR